MSKLIFRYGSMNASKSAQLIMDWYNSNENNKQTIVFKPSTDTRMYDIVHSRAVNTEVKAVCINPEENNVMYKYVMANQSARIVLVDEVQFLTKKQIEELAKIVDVIGVTVIAYGLMTNFKGELFEGSKRLVELSDVVERIRSECTICDKEGIMNARFINGEFATDGEEILIGAEETYKVLCRRCYNKAVGEIL